MKPRYISLHPFIDWTKAKRPIPWSEEFARSAGLEVEIGFGTGDFLVQRALENKDRDFVGMELGWVLVRRALRKIGLAGVENVRVMRVDARVAFQRVFVEGCLDRVWALFPCPWPKEKHASHRLFSHAFFKLINSRLKPEGKINIVTDYAPYFDWIISQLPGTGFEIQTEKIPPQFFTKYEKKWRELGQYKFYHLVLRKQEHQQIQVKKDINMITHQVGGFDPDRFNPRNEGGKIVVQFKDFLYDSTHLRGMIRSIVGEENLIQDIWIEIAKRDEHWHIRPAKGCSIIPTAGVQRALDLVRDGVEEKI